MRKPEEQGEPKGAKDLENPAFLRWVREQFPRWPVEPDEEDFDRSVPAPTVGEQARQYR